MFVENLHNLSDTFVIACLIIFNDSVNQYIIYKYVSRYV